MASFFLKGRLTLLFLVCQLAFGIHTLPLQAEETSADTKSEENVATAAEATEGVEGVATYYAKRYNGRRTNSGVRYDPDKLTAAHPTLPHGSKVKVINLANLKEVVVTINDRCRKRKVEHIDLSRAAAQKLGFLGKGLAKVKIIPLEQEST